MKQTLKALTDNVSPRERKILLVMALLLLAFALSALLPALQDDYQQRQAEIESLALDVAREQRLNENAERWRERREEVEARRSELEGQLFSGATVPLVEAAIQRDLTQYARNAGIDVLSTRLAERQNAEGWLMISQEMSFRTRDAGNSIRFLEFMENSTPRLFVRDFSLDHSRNNFSGAITVVGFARSGELDTDALASQR
ncbi:MAG: type II secretion system protein GspM [Pseudohongiellaceae bacterium]